MDILKRYEEETSQASPQASQLNLSQEYGALTNIIIRLSGGAVSDQRQANVILLAIAAVIVGISVYFFLSSGRSDLPPLKVVSPELLNNAQRIR